MPVGSTRHTRRSAAVPRNGGAAAWKAGHQLSRARCCMPASSALGKWKHEDQRTRPAWDTDPVSKQNQHPTTTIERLLLRKPLQQAISCSCKDPHFHQGAQKQVLLCAGKLEATKQASYTVVLRRRRCGWRYRSAVKSNCCFCEEPGFCSQHPHRGTHNTCSSIVGGSYTPFWPHGMIHMCTYAPTDTYP